MGNKIATSTGTTILEVLFVILVVLKLLGWISISWWWVFAPIWVPAIIVCVVLAGFFVIYKSTK